MNLTDVQRRVLIASQLDALATIDSIARKAACKVHTARYALEQLTQKQIIKPYTFINYHRLRLLHYALYFSVAGGSHSSHDLLTSRIAASDRIAWASEVGGEYQYLVTLLSATPDEVYHFLHSFPKEVRFLHKAIAVRLEWHSFLCKYLLPDKKLTAGVSAQQGGKAVSIDELDHKILSALSEMTVGSQHKIAKLLGAPLSTVSRRISRLEESGVITAYVHWVACQRFGAHPFRLLISERGANSRLKNDLLEFSRRHPHIIGFVHCLGNWDFELRVELWEPAAVNLLIQEVYDRFGPSIESVSAIPMLSTFKMVGYPFRSAVASGGNSSLNRPPI